MSKRWMVAASVLAVAGMSGSAMAHGLIRSGGLVPDHSALSIGQSGALLSSYTLGNANPTISTTPFNSASGGDAGFYTDVASPYTSTSNYVSNFGSTTTTNQLSAFKWFAFANPSAGGTRNILGDGSYGSLTSQTYSGNTSTITFNNFGTGSWRVNIVITTTVADGASAGQGKVISTATVTRVGGLFNDASAYTLSAGVLFDLDVGSNGSSSDTVTDVSGAGERRFRYTDSSGVTGETLAISPTSYSVNTRSTVATALDGSAALNNTLTSVTDSATAYLWDISLPTVGSSVSLSSAFSIGTTATVPEPTTLGLLGATALVALRRRSR